MLILVVDDDPTAAMITAAIVEDEGHETLVAENVVEALEIFTSNPEIALVISDMNMPLITGVELFQELREQDSQVPFILLSGDNPDEALKLEVRLNASLLKDVSLHETLIVTITEVMDKK